jgi:hypothetical protein
MPVSRVDLAELGGVLGHFVITRGGEMYRFTHRVSGEVLSVPRQVLDALWCSGVSATEACKTVIRPLVCVSCGRARDLLDWTLCDSCRRGQVVPLR